MDTLDTFGKVVLAAVVLAKIALSIQTGAPVI